MLLTKNAEFFRQKEKNVGFIKSSDGGDGGLHERNGSTSPGIPLPGMRAVIMYQQPSNVQSKGKTFLTMIGQQDMPSNSTRESENTSPYNTVTRFAASRSSPSIASHTQDDALRRTESLPTPKESTSPTKPSMPWLMPSSTRGAGGFVTSAALKRSSTLTRAPPTPETTDIRARPATMYARSGHQRNFGGSVASTRSLSPSKRQFQDPEPEKPLEKPADPYVEQPREPSPIEDEAEEQVPTPPPHRTPLNRSEMGSALLTTPPSSHEGTSSAPLRIPTSTGTDAVSRKAWSPTKSSWLDSALHKSNEPTGSPPKRTNSIRPIPPAVPHQWSNERTATPRITKSTSFTSALGGMGGRRDVTGITPTTSSRGSVESRLAALEKKNISPPPPRSSELPRSQSLRETLKPTPSPPPTTKPKKWDSPTDNILAARQGLSRTQTKPNTFSDPLKEGILAAREKLRVQDKPREERTDELKMSILNARKGLKRAGSKGEQERGDKELKNENSPAPREREKTPAIEEEEVVVKREEITPKKMPIDIDQTPAVAKLPNMTPVSPPRKPAVQVTPKPVEHLTMTSVDRITTKPAEQHATKPIERVSPSKVTAIPPPEKEIEHNLRQSPAPNIESSKTVERVSSTKETTPPPVPPKQVDYIPYTVVKVSSPKSVERVSPSKVTSVPPVYKKEVNPPSPMQKHVTKVESPRKDDDSPTPRKKFPKPDDTQSPENKLVETPLKPTDPIKQKSLPIPPKEDTSIKGIPIEKITYIDSIVNRFNPALVNILSKGMPMSSRPVPIKSKSAPEPRSIVEDIDGGKQLTHLTKGRARGPKKRNSIKSEKEKSEMSTPAPALPIKGARVQSVTPTPLQPVPMKRPIIKDEPDSPPPIQSSIWNKPPVKERPIVTSREKLFDVTFPSTPEILPRPATTATLSREHQTAVSTSGSMKQRFADLSPLRRDSKSSTLSLLGSLLRSPSQPTYKPKYPAIEIIPSPTTTKIHDKERLFVQAWSIVSRVTHISLPNTEEHVLYSKDMHAFLYMYNDEPGASEPSAIKFLWVGRDCTLDVKEGMEFVRLMGDQNADTQVIHQGHETPFFVRALGGVIVTRNGSRRSLDSIEDAIFCVRQCLGGISIDQVPFRKGEFCSGFSFVVKTDGNVFVWHGNGSLSEEIAAARRFAGESGEHVKEMVEADPSGCSELWKCFDDFEYASGEFWRGKCHANGFIPILYLIEGQKVDLLESG